MRPTNSFTLLAVIALALIPGVATAGDCTPPASGLYEGYSPITMQPYGVLQSKDDALLGMWLDVETADCVANVTIQPEGTLTWALRYGADGLEEKVASVDGELWTRSEFQREDGRLVAKVVTGPGVVTKQQFVYETDDKGRVTRRTGEVPGGGATTTLDWAVSYSDKGAKAVTTVGGTDIRIDTFDLDGARLMSSFGVPADGPDRLKLRYKRKKGVLASVRRTLGKAKEQVVPTIPDATIQTEHVQQFHGPIERWEVLLVLGPANIHQANATGVLRTVEDDFIHGCALNDPSGLRFDAAGALVSSTTACICGFCVEVSSVASVLDGDQVLGVDEHWSRGPWIELDGNVMVTAEHLLVTPDGPRAAGDLQAGDLVTGEDGEPRALGSVVRVELETPRLGRNLRTTSGQFVAGGFVFVSEQARVCPSP